MQEGAVLLDVRKPDEWSAGHAADAIHIPLAADRAPHRTPGRSRDHHRLPLRTSLDDRRHSAESARPARHQPHRWHGRLGGRRTPGWRPTRAPQPRPPSGKDMVDHRLGVDPRRAVGLLGGGGSILAVPALVYGASMPLSAAISTSLIVVGISSLIAALPRLNQVRWRLAAVFAGPGAAAAFAAPQSTGTWSPPSYWSASPL